MRPGLLLSAHCRNGKVALAAAQKRRHLGAAEQGPQALRLQHGFDAISLMPTNLYGPGDNYHPMNSHVLPALIRRFHEATQSAAPSVTCWGTGSPMREFLHVDDLGEACVFALERWQPGPEDPPHLNVGTGVDCTIRELAEAVA